ncbi:MAG: peptidylprolyl isomerase [Verrucomicrobiae bacterium]|nr:peptidylprolyl isomerase [Verrucomicrobiae bacterium]
MTTIEKDKVASIHYKLTNDAGDVVDTSQGREPLEYLHGHGNIVAGLENALTGKSEGESLKVSVSPEEGYGQPDESLVIDVPREHLPVEELAPGMRFSAETSAGMRLFTVQEVGEDKVKLDGNHPLAGETLHFEVDVVGVRDAQPEEISHGHVHGPGGHSHEEEEGEGGGCGEGCGCH